MRIYIIALLCVGIFFCGVQAKNWPKWAKIRSLIVKHINLKHTIGNVPISYNFFEDGIVASANPLWHYNDQLYGPNQIDVLHGKGFLLKGGPDGKPKGKYATVTLSMPKVVSACGIFLGSRHDAGDDYVEGVKIYYRTNSSLGYRLMADAITGDFIFKPKFTSISDFRAIFFDPVPAKDLKVYLYYRDNKRPSIRVTVFHSCSFQNTKIITRCNEMIENNTRFNKLPFNKAIHIQCPLDCILTRPCWGYKVYSSDSPICWTATQYFGRQGKGTYTLYRIEQAVKFGDQLNPKYNNKIYCRKYSRRYEAFTFDRKFMDYTIKQYRDLYGAK